MARIEKGSKEATTIALKLRTVDFSQATPKCPVCREEIYGLRGSVRCDKCGKRFHLSGCGLVGPLGPDGEEYAFCHRCIAREYDLEPLLGR